MTPPFTKVFERTNVPDGWNHFIHPEGALYFFNEQKVNECPSFIISFLRFESYFQKIVTDAYLCEPAILAEINQFSALVDRILGKENNRLASNVELVLEQVVDSDRVIEWGYYFVDHGSRCLFWARLLRCLTETKHEIQSQYWCVNAIATQLKFDRKHWEYFPILNFRNISQEILDELEGHFNYAISGEVMKCHVLWTTSPGCLLL